MDQSLVFDIDLIRRYDKEGPRYTSYPTAPQFHEGFNEAEYRRIAQASNVAGGPLSLYFHIPFCDTVCYYCGCNKVVTKHRDRAAPYLERLYREIAMQAELFDSDRVVEQLHWGGGTPTFISHDEMRTLMATTRKHFRLMDDDRGEYSIEIDPREASAETIAVLRELGFNRMSMGVQDFDPAVQKAVNRIQSFAETATVADAARANGFKSVSIDLIYGLPHQSMKTFEDTLDKVLRMDPDRLSVFNYAHLPHLFMPQRRINEAELPSATDKLDILQYIIGRLTDAGYVFIGMDHFAKPDDELAVAQRQGRLHRNFQGYSTHAECDMMSFGISSIGMVGPSYCQNVKTLDEYYDRLDNGVLPVYRGIELTPDDLLRRSIIQALMCHFEVSIEGLEVAHLIDFKRYFADEIADLREMEKGGLLKLDDKWISVQPRGRMLVRAIAMVFDRYLRADRARARYSKVI